MEANEGIESYELLLAVCREKGVELVVGYKQMRDKNPPCNRDNL